MEPAGGPTERAPGLADAFAATYVEPGPDHRRRSFLVGGAIALGVVAVVTVVALSSRAGDGRDEVRSEPSRRVLKTVTTSTTWAPASTTTTAPVPPTAAPPTTAPAPTAPTTPTTAPPARATADPALPRYAPVPLPAGVGATIGGCSWQPTAGGRYEAAGTLSGNRAWTVTVHWLQDGREVGEESAVVNPGPPGSKPWSLVRGAPSPPADPFSCALSVA
ncbi:MAG TPA: hypothetical protein VGN59_17050 [Acidimicrobiia bacterium]